MYDLGFLHAVGRMFMAWGSVGERVWPGDMFASMTWVMRMAWGCVDLYIRPGLQVWPRHIGLIRAWAARDRKIQELQVEELWIIKLNIKTRPDTQLMATVDAVTAECDGRYSEGSQSKFFEPHVIHVRSEPTP